MRMKIPVGVACDSDPQQVIETLLSCVKNHTDVASRPEPVVRFLKYGDSTLDFELRVWIKDFDDYRRVQSEILQRIHQQFRAEGIEIAYPQRDLHLRIIDKSNREELARPES